MNKIKQQFNNIFKQLKKLLKYDYYKQIFKKQNTIPMTLCIAKKYGKKMLLKVTKTNMTNYKRIKDVI